VNRCLQWQALSAARTKGGVEPPHSKVLRTSFVEMLVKISRSSKQVSQWSLH
jgi:hypothetical protein